jgi:hypothetical protein
MSDVTSPLIQTEGVHLAARYRGAFAPRQAAGATR